jgi:V8-like Glu-specific endopeptidase
MMKQVKDLEQKNRSVITGYPTDGQQFVLSYAAKKAWNLDTTSSLTVHSIGRLEGNEGMHILKLDDTEDGYIVVGGHYLLNMTHCNRVKSDPSEYSNTA